MPVLQVGSEVGYNERDNDTVITRGRGVTRGVTTDVIITVLCSPPAHPPPAPSQAALEEGCHSVSGDDCTTDCSGRGEGVRGRWTYR